MKVFLYTSVLILFLSFNLQAQKDSVKIKKKKRELVVKDYDPSDPAKAAFLSAVLPGAGQIYNKRYWWQLPLIYGGLGFSIYSYIDQNNNFNRFRTAFRRRQAGLSDEFTINGIEIISDDGLQNAQEQANTNRNLSLLSAILVYVLQITEASVRAHLLQFSTSEDLSIVPITIPDTSFKEAPKVGLTIKYSF